ncbi:MAG TPA: hypothetical protein VFI96_01125, partial [Longimicrobiaceae bacterium]|nr:hypothetical protein [Longimicrobiaceae bacterium]
MFTAHDLFLEASVEAPELLSKPVDPHVIAATFNAALRDLVMDVVDADAERLAQRYDVPEAVVALDPIDLTDDGTGTGTRAWLHIDYIDWQDASGEGDEVWLPAIEARNRAVDAYPDVVVGMLENQYRSLRKLAGWSSVRTLLVYGVLAPTKVALQTLATVQHDYPPVLESALKWEWLAQLGGIIGADAQRQQKWALRRQ